MPLKELHEAIQHGHYHKVEKIIIDESLNPLVEYNGKTAIALCFVVQARKKLENGNIYHEMLENLLFPQLDRWLIGNGKAKRGDIMLIESNGNINVLKNGAKFDEDNARYRPIGEDDYRLSEDFRVSRHNVEKSYRY